MSRTMLLVTAAAALAISCVSAYLARPAAPDGLVAVEPVQYLGELTQGATVPAEFQLVNQSWERIEIVDILKGCTCTEAELSKRTLAPGEGTALKVKWSIGGRRGRIASDVSVVSARAGRAPESLQVWLEADILPDYLYEPTQLAFRVGQPATKEVVFSSGQSKDVTLRNAYCTHRAFEVRLRPGMSRVEVSFAPEQWTPDVSTVDLIIETNNPNEPRCTVPITVE